nr:uncharacterized protein C20orf196 homolog [Pogona vitticeps]
MEGSGTASSHQSEESSLLDIPCLLNAESFGLNLNPGMNDEALSSADAFVSPASTAGNTDPSSIDFKGNASGADITLCPQPCEKTDLVNCVNTEPFLPELPLSWTYEQKDEGESTLKKSLDTFYGTCCQKKPHGGSPEYEAASQCVSVKMAELADKGGMNYALKSLRIAQMVLNRDGTKVLPQHSRNTCFSTPPKVSLCLEPKRQVPGLSDDILQLIMNQNAMK